MYFCLISTTKPYRPLACENGETAAEAIRNADAKINRIIHAPATVKVINRSRLIMTVEEYSVHMAVRDALAFAERQTASA